MDVVAKNSTAAKTENGSQRAVEALTKKLYKLTVHSGSRVRELLLQKTELRPFPREHRFIFSLAEIKEIPMIESDFAFILLVGPKFQELPYADLIAALRRMDAGSLMARVLLYAIGSKRAGCDGTPRHLKKTCGIFLNLGWALTESMVIANGESRERQAPSSKRSSLVTRPWDARWFPERFQPKEGNPEISKHGATVVEAYAKLRKQ